MKIMAECKPLTLKSISTFPSVENIVHNAFSYEEEIQRVKCKENFEVLKIKPTLPKMFVGERKQVATRIGGRKSKDFWNFSDLRKMCDEKYGKGNIILHHITNIKNLHDQIGFTEKFLAECYICEFIWTTKIHLLYTGDKGCPWCKNKCRNIKSFDLYTVIFIGEKIYEGKYYYVGEGINNENIASEKANLNIDVNMMNMMLLSIRYLNIYLKQ